MSVNIQLTLPFKAEFVSTARLVASSVASRAGFHIEAIEDIRVAIAEVCNEMVKVGGDSTRDYKIAFSIEETQLQVRFSGEDESLRKIFAQKEDELGLSIIIALMDYVELCKDGEDILSMSKSLEGNS